MTVYSISMVDSGKILDISSTYFDGSKVKNV